MSVSEFKVILEKIKGRVKFVYLHVMGEPLLHPALGEFLSLLRAYSIPACITTNGTLLATRGELLLEYSDVVHKVSLSLHAPEGNAGFENEKYMENAIDFAIRASEKGIYTVFRLWNMPSEEQAEYKNRENPKIESALRERFPGQWRRRPRGYMLADRIFLEYDGVFVWPDRSQAEPREELFCHALSSQLAILADGTVVPCCLDNEGNMPLGNIFSSSLEEILSSSRALAISEGFSHGYATERLCKKCSYARRFKVRNN